MNYTDFLANKALIDSPSGITVPKNKISDALFDFQKDIVHWSLKRGRAALFEDCGLGKTIQQLEWARHIPGNVLILAPLAVAQQTIREGGKFGIEAQYCRNQQQIKSRIVIANYEMLEHFNPAYFTGVVLDESSILKSFSGKMRNDIISSFQQTPFKLACTATPAPNDYMELGNHSEFLGVMNQTEMLAMFFTHDGGDTSKWRLKGHAESEYWKWLCSWAVMIRKPSDLGYEDNNFKLPAINFHEHIIQTDIKLPDQLFVMNAETLSDRQNARKMTIKQRAEKCAKLVNGDSDIWLVWCNLNEESAILAKMINGSVEVKGSDSNEHKEKTLFDFSTGKIKCLITKPSIAGFGMNFQLCKNVAFVGLSDSYEQFYQAVRRCWRFGQKKPVDVHVITADVEGAVVKNIKRKENDAMKMADEMVKHMHVINEQNIKNLTRQTTSYEPNKKMEIPKWI